MSASLHQREKDEEEQQQFMSYFDTSTLVAGRDLPPIAEVVDFLPTVFQSQALFLAYTTHRCHCHTANRRSLSFFRPVYVKQSFLTI